MALLITNHIPISVLALFDAELSHLNVDDFDNWNASDLPLRSRH